MLWLLYSLLAVISDSIRLVFVKRIVQDVDEYVLAFVIQAFVLPLLGAFLFFSGIPKVDTTFWLATLGSTVTLTLGSILYMKALRVSPMSLVTPFLNFTPLFLLVTSPIMLGEYPSFYGYVGILFVVFGAYVVTVKEGSLLRPFELITRERGILYVLLVSLIYSVGANFDKMAILHSSAAFYLFVLHIFTTIVFLPILYFKSKNPVSQFASHWKTLSVIGFFVGLMFIFHMLAITLQIVPYVVSIKRLSILASIVFGALLFNEKNGIYRFSGAVFMLVGAVIISFS